SRTGVRPRRDDSQDCRQYAWLRDQCSYDSGHAIAGHGAAKGSAELAFADQFADRSAGLGAQGLSCATRVGQSSYKNPFDVQVIRVLKKNDGRINFFGELLARDRHSACVLQSPEKQHLVVVQNRDADGTSVYLNHKSRTAGV